ncbi:hypothetical protein [Brevibacillus brevis]|uniref:hypothetical protein n=1 Tax=Brevibacillus brevis TaxID=1393 RepID=UPI00115720E1|nr:hypothetical protein [Lysinibacillus sp. SDF0063]TQR31029.1 hypothetical protein C7Y45_24300 [Lysinibacillus sp. SDF0063]
MWTILMILMISLHIALIEVPYLRRNAMKKEMLVFFIFLGIGTGLCIAESLKANIPNPLDWITYVYKPFSDFIFGTVE